MELAQPMMKINTDSIISLKVIKELGIKSNENYQKNSNEGVVIIEPRLLKDERRKQNYCIFFESFRVQREFEEKIRKISLYKTMRE